MTLRRDSPLRGRRIRWDEVALERFAMSRAGYQFLLHVAPTVDRWLIPRTGGRLSSMGMDKIGTLTTKGAKSGQPRTQPLVMIAQGPDLLVVGSNYGRPPHPAWTHNLLSDPSCTVEFRGPEAPYTATLLTGDERRKAWETAVDFYAGYEAYRATCAPREIRLFRLSPAS